MTPPRSSIEPRAPAPPKRRDWLRWDGGPTLLCERCGEKYEMALPASLNIVSAIAKAFAKDHHNCKPKAEPR